MQIQMIRISRIPSWSASVVAVASTVVARILHQQLGAEMTLCTFKTVTGLPCLTCGATRSALSTLGGRLVTAFLYNPLVFFVALVAGTFLLLRVVFGRTVRLNLRGRRRTAAWILAVALMLANWAYLIAVGR